MNSQLVLKESDNVKSMSPKKFNAKLPFSHLPPYDLVFAERVPLLQAFQLAMGNYVRHARLQKPSLFDRFSRWLAKDALEFRAAECGVYTGSSLLACAQMARDAGLVFRIHGLDTFSGLPALTPMDELMAPEKAKYRTETLFSDTSIDFVRERLISVGFEKNVVLHQGLFFDSLKTLPEQTYHFVNIDCDLYAPHLECLEYFYPRMEVGGVLFFDDYHSIEYPMAGKAIDAFMTDKTEHLMHLRFGEDGPNRTKAFIVKI